MFSTEWLPTVEKKLKQELQELEQKNYRILEKMDRRSRGEIISDLKRKLIKYLSPEVVNKLNHGSIMYGVNLMMTYEGISLNEIKSMIFTHDETINQLNKQKQEAIILNNIDRERRKSEKIFYEKYLNKQKQHLEKLKKQIKFRTEKYNIELQQHLEKEFQQQYQMEPIYLAPMEYDVQPHPMFGVPLEPILKQQIIQVNFFYYEIFFFTMKFFFYFFVFRI